MALSRSGRLDALGQWWTRMDFRERWSLLLPALCMDHLKLWSPLGKEISWALNWIVSIWPLPSCRSHYSLQFTEELREMKQVKRGLEYFWHSTRDELNWTQIRATIKAYLVIVKVPKCQHFFLPLLHLQIAVLWPCFRWYKPLQWYAEEFIQHLSNNVAWVSSQLDTGLDADSEEMSERSLV